MSRNSEHNMITRGRSSPLSAVIVSSSFLPNSLPSSSSTVCPPFYYTAECRCWRAHRCCWPEEETAAAVGWGTIHFFAAVSSQYLFDLRANAQCSHLLRGAAVALQTYKAKCKRSCKVLLSPVDKIIITLV